MAAPAVSIGIPAYARPHELQRAIKSVLDQGIADVEVIVGDDSGDLEPFVDAIGDDRVRYVRNPTRLGMAGNWNAVLDRCAAPLVGLLMDDDELLPGFLPAVLERFKAEPDLGVVFTDHVFRDANDTWRRECGLAAGRYDDFVLPLMKHRPVAVSAAVMRRDVWAQVRPLPDMLTADMVMHLRIALARHAFYYIAEPLMAYAVHPEQQSASSPRFRRDQVLAWDMFGFVEPEAEELRRHYLAKAKVSVAAADLREGRFSDAQRSLAEARKLGVRATGVSGLALEAMAQLPTVGQLALRVWRRRSRAG